MSGKQLKIIEVEALKLIYTYNNYILYLCKTTHDLSTCANLE